MARLKSELAPEALRDAAFAVALDPASYKAVHKRSRAKQQLRLWQVRRAADSTGAGSRSYVKSSFQ